MVGPYGGTVRSSAPAHGHRTQRWAIITGSGADSTTLRAAAAAGIDTLITGEGPHHTTVDAPDLGLMILYCGHYASETLGVQALASRIGEQFNLPAEFLLLPTGS
jgi:putative NIF3 family GTP cyclohydrolase 1 type 2